MKKFGIIFFVLIALFFGYLAWSYFAFPISDTAAGKAVNNSGKNIKGFQEDLLSSGKKQIESAKSFVAQIPEDANNAFNDIVDQTKNTIREKLDTILGTTSPSVSPSVSVNAVTGAGISQNSSAEPNVCSVVSKGEFVGYSIDRSFPGTQGTSYKVAWGDGEAVNGVFRSGDQNVAVSHSYAQQGTYSIVFQIISSLTTLTASRSVCVK